MRLKTSDEEEMSDDEDRLSLDDLNLWDDECVFPRKQSIRHVRSNGFLSPADDRLSLSSAGSVCSLILK
jgi:hypothetical protein